MIAFEVVVIGLERLLAGGGILRYRHGGTSSWQAAAPAASAHSRCCLDYTGKPAWAGVTARARPCTGRGRVGCDPPAPQDRGRWGEGVSAPTGDRCSSYTSPTASGRRR